MTTATEFLPISVSTLVPAGAVGLDLFVSDTSDDDGRLVLFRGSENPLHEDDLQRLKEQGVRQLFIDSTSRERYQEYLHKMATLDSAAPNVPLSVRLSALGEVIREVLKTSFESGEVDPTVRASREFGAYAAEIICQDRFHGSDLFGVLHHDYATFTHSTNVAFYAGLLARRLSMSKEEVGQIITGGLLHDLGKMQIDESILCKPGRLDEHEFRQIKMHPTYGFRLLARREDLSVGQLMMVYQHHERFDGGGYPVGVTGVEVHPWARICAVVDVFEALTSHRPYRMPMSSDRALEIQERDRETAFDPEMLRCWQAIIHHDWKS